MECVYQVNEHFGAYGEGMRYLERDGHRPFYPNGVAFIDYRVTPIDGGYLLSYQVKTQESETVALRRWATKHQTEIAASIAVIEAAASAARAYDSRVTCMIGIKLAGDVVDKFKRELEE